MFGLFQVFGGTLVAKSPSWLKLPNLALWANSAGLPSDLVCASRPPVILLNILANLAQFGILKSHWKDAFLEVNATLIGGKNTLRFSSKHKARAIIPDPNTGATTVTSVVCALFLSKL